MEWETFVRRHPAAYARLRVAAGRNIRRWRRARGMKQSELCRAIGRSQSTLSRIERGAQHLTLERLSALATYLEVPVTALLRLRPQT